MKLVWHMLNMFTTAFLTSSINAADFSVRDNRISINGNIEVGDYQRFRDFVLTGENFWAMGNVFLNSVGGDVGEALKFANLFDKSFSRTWVMEKCYSSCFIMWAGGVERTVMVTAEIGVHRITTRDIGFDIQKTKGLISPIAADIGNYLRQLGIPSALIDQMNETPASSIFTMDALSIKAKGWYLTLGYQPIYLDTIERACGKSPDPYPGEYIRDRPRDPQTMSLITEWVKCMRRIQLKNKILFAIKEFDYLEAGKPTILMTPNRRKEAKALLTN